MNNVDDIYSNLKNLEIILDSGCPLLGRYRLLKQKEILEGLDIVKNSIPKEIVETKNSLIKNGHGYVFNAIEEFQNIIEKSFKILPNVLIIINVEQILVIIDNIYANLPVDMLEARKILKS